jgi:hypothetical protein
MLVYTVCWLSPVPVAARSKEWVCGRSPAEIVGSNPAGVMDVCLFWVFRVVATSWSLVQMSPTDCCSRRCVWSRNLVNEETMVRVRPKCHEKKYLVTYYLYADICHSQYNVSRLILADMVNMNPPRLLKKSTCISTHFVSENNTT